MASNISIILFRGMISFDYRDERDKTNVKLSDNNPLEILVIVLRTANVLGVLFSLSVANDLRNLRPMNVSLL